MKSKFIQNNWTIIVLIISSILTELVGVLITAHKFYIRNPLVFFSILFIFAAILYLIRNKTARLVVAIIMYIIIGSLNVGFVLLYYMTGQTFEFSMMDLKGDGLGALENIQLNFAISFMVGAIVAALIVFGLYINKITIPLKKLKGGFIQAILLLGSGMGFFVVFINISFNNQTIYERMLYSNSDYSYNDLGITSNTFAQLLLGPKGSPQVKVSDEDMEKYLFNEEEIYYSQFPENANKNYNVITILCESFEWMGFVEDKEAFPNGLDLTIPEEYADSDKTATELLFPNLYGFMQESKVFSNYYSKEKTDISENLTHFGAYPNEVLTNYDFVDNSYPQSDANMLKTLYPEIKANNFHNGLEVMYNRNIFELSLGFDKFYGREELFNHGLNDYGFDLCLDSELMTSVANLSFPEDERFFNYLITITQHGNYEERDNLASHYERLAEFGLTFTGDEQHDQFVTYVATALEVDKAIGELNSILEERNLKDKTIITLFADHNAYYDSLTNYIKGMDTMKDAEKQERNYLDVYRLPLIMYIPDSKPEVIDKFVTTADILPTIFDVLGINFYKNIYFGNSIFSQEETLMHSRAYNFFTDGKLYYTSLTKVKFSYQDAELTDELVSKTEKLVEKMIYIDQMILQDFFHKEVPSRLKSGNIQTYEDLYKTKILQIN